MKIKRNNGKQPPTMRAIAEKTGYSVNTVSRALRDKEDIAPETRGLIKRTARELGYISNTIASSLRLGYTNTIAVILGDVSNPHFAIMMKEIEERARELGYFSFLINTGEDEELEYRALLSALNKNVDGIVWCPAQKSTANIEYLQSTGVPFVLIGRRFDGIPSDYVVCNDELGGYQATRHLLDLGHRRILLLSGPGYISSARERRAGYERALAESGVETDPALIREIPLTSNCCLQELEQEYSAVFAFSDLVAWDAWACLLRQGRRVPQDCSIVGFDHIQSRMSLPFLLTSIRSYKKRMSTAAVEVLCRKIREGGAMETIVIDTELAVGETTAPYEEKPARD